MDFSLEISGRVSEKREKLVQPVIRFEIEEIKKHFDSSIQAIEDMFEIADNLLNSSNKDKAKDIWRAQIVFLESAFDFYIHEITKFGLEKIFKGEWEKTEKYNNISLTLEILTDAINSGENTDWFVEYINNQYAKDTMVSFSGVKDQLNLLGLDIQKVAQDSFYCRDETEKPIDKLKHILNFLYARRNIIAHQSDRRHENAEKYEISKEVVNSFLKDINLIVNNITNQIMEK